APTASEHGQCDEDAKAHEDAASPPELGGRPGMPRRKWLRSSAGGRVSHIMLDMHLQVGSTSFAAVASVLASLAACSASESNQTSGDSGGGGFRSSTGSGASSATSAVGGSGGI